MCSNRCPTPQYLNNIVLTIHVYTHIHETHSFGLVSYTQTVNIIMTFVDENINFTQVSRIHVTIVITVYYWFI